MRPAAPSLAEPMLRHVRPTAALHLAAVLALTACEAPAPVVVGISTSEAYVDAARLALEHARADGLRLPVDTVVIPEHGNQAAPAIQASERFLATPGLVAVVGHSNSAASLAASQLYNRNRIVQIAPTASAVVYSRAGPYSFRLVPPDDRQGAFLAGLVAEAVAPGGRAAVLYVNDDYGRGLHGTFNAALRGSGVEVALDLPFMENGLSQADIAQTIATLARSRPDVLVWLGRGSTLDLMLGQIRDALGPVRVIGGDALSSAQQLDPLHAFWAGVTHVEYGDLEATPEGRRFRRDYEARFGRSASIPAALTYDAMRMLLDAIGAGAGSGDEVREYLQALGRSRPAFAGTTGPVQFDATGDVEGGYRVVEIQVPAVQ